MNTGFLIVVILRLLQIYNYLILARVLLSWFIRDPMNPIYRFLWSITEPVLSPIRRILPQMGGWDFSPIVAFLLIDVLSRFLISIL